jgi:c-di-GMP-binding flagellar brake protein YcgR
MNIKRFYNRCNITGTGFLNLEGHEKIKFAIIDLSASGIKIKVNEKLELDSLVEVDFYLDNNSFRKQIRTYAKVLREHNNDNTVYGLKFIGLNNFLKIEIDEIMKTKCDLSKVNNNRICEDGHCVFFRSVQG